MKSSTRHGVFALMCLLADACASGGARVTYYAPGATGPCDGEDFVDVSNRGPTDVEIYANTSRELFSPSAGMPIGTAPKGTSRIGLAGFGLQGKPAGFIAFIDGRPSGEVSFRRGCEQRAKP